MDLSELSLLSNETVMPQLVDPCNISIGGVDPLGLRQINFDMMDQVLPGLNNVARHIRPYILMAWAWRRAEQIAKEQGGAEVKELRDFVDRIETIYAWSQFLVDPETDLPGRQALSPLLEAKKFVFGGKKWKKFRDVRRYSTGLIAAVNYGPSLRNMEWIKDLSELPGTGVSQRGAYKANPHADSDFETALVQFESCFEEALDHEAFNTFEPVTVKRKKAKKWGRLWAMDSTTAEGQIAAWTRINSGIGGEARKRGLQLVHFAATYQTDGVNEERDVRRVMSDVSGVTFPAELEPYAVAWRRMQVRQVFRLILEGLLHWTERTLGSGVKTTKQLAAQFLEQTGTDADQKWLKQFEFSDDPIDHLEKLQASFAQIEEFPKVALEALRFCMAEAPETGEHFERQDRLPLSKAAKDWQNWSELGSADLVGRIIESWLLAQHTYWSVGRGLQDARNDGKTILRLRIFIDEGGWRMADGFNPGGAPNPTPDRIATALSLIKECGIFETKGVSGLSSIPSS